MATSGGRGRPTEQTEQTVKTLVACLARCASVRDACAYAGISISTFHRWVRWGEEGRDASCVAVAQRIARARAKAVMDLGASVAADPDWRAKAWVMSRLDRESWGDKPSADDAEPGTCAVRTLTGSVELLMRLIPEERRADAREGLRRLYEADGGLDDGQDAAGPTGADQGEGRPLP